MLNGKYNFTLKKLFTIKFLPEVLEIFIKNPSEKFTLKEMQQELNSDTLTETDIEHLVELKLLFKKKIDNDDCYALRTWSPYIQSFKKIYKYSKKNQNTLMKYEEKMKKKKENYLWDSLFGRDLPDWDILLDKFSTTPLIDKVSNRKIIFHYLGDKTYILSMNATEVTLKKLRRITITDYITYSNVEILTKGTENTPSFDIRIDRKDYSNYNFNLL